MARATPGKTPGQRSHARLQRWAGYDTDELLPVVADDIVEALEELLEEIRLMRHEARSLTHDENTCKVCRPDRAGGGS